MNYLDTEKITVEAVTEYYKGNMGIFYQYLHPEIVVISVGKGQILAGRKCVMENMKNGNNLGICYDVEEITCKSYRIDGNSCHTVLDSTILVCYPNQFIERVNQRVTVVWKYIREKDIQKEQVEAEGWYGLQLHISLGKETQQKPLMDAHFSVNTFAEIMHENPIYE